MTPLFTKLQQYIKDQGVIAANNYKIVSNGLLALAKINFYKFLKNIKPLIDGIILIAKVIFALTEMALFLLFISMKPLPAKIKTGIKAFYALSKTTLYSLTKGIILITRVIFAIIRLTLFLLFLIVRELLTRIKTAAKTFYALVKAVLHAIFKGIKNGLSSINKFISGIRRKLAAWENRFILHQKLRLLKIRNQIKQSVLFNKLKQYALLIRLDKPIGILLLLWPTLIALWIAAGGWPDTDVLLVFVAGVFLMRSAGCAINDYADRHIDRLVTRTKNRPLTSGKITSIEALLIFAALCIAAFSLVILMNPLTIVMSLIGLVLAASYPFMKRHHYLPQVHLGAAFGWAVPMAYAAQTNELSPVAWLLFIATVLWATAYDTMYAMVDREDDLKIGIKSTAILFEDADKLIIGIIQAILILCLIMIGQKIGLGGFYFTGVAIASVLLIWQQYLIRDRQPAECFQAFLNNNWFGLVLFVGVFLEYQLGGITS